MLDLGDAHVNRKVNWRIAGERVYEAAEEDGSIEVAGKAFELALFADGRAKLEQSARGSVRDRHNR